MWPNLAVLEEAPTTAKCLDEKKVLMEASVLMVGEGSVMGGGTGAVGTEQTGYLELIRETIQLPQKSVSRC